MRCLPFSGWLCYYTLAALLAVFSTACRKPSDSLLDDGVSIELMRRRAGILSDIRYKLFFSLTDSLQQPVAGKQEILFTVSQINSPLILDFSADPSQIRSVEINGRAGAYRFVNGHIVFSEKDIVPGENAIRIEFIAGDGPLNRTEAFMYSLFVPDRASEAFPCFEQPNLKARFTLSLELPSDWIAVSNGNTVTKRVDGARSFYAFQETELLPTYLFAFAAGKFQVVREQRGNRLLEMYHREIDHDKLRRNTKDIFDLHVNALDWLENYAGIPYPFQKFAFVLIPAFQYGGMEHPGTIFYRANRLLLDASATQSDVLGRASLIAHETAHIWFGDLVTMDWFDDVWMKEVFANFMAAKITNPAFPALNHDLRFVLAHYPAAYRVDRTRGANPIRQRLDNLNEAGSLYGAIIYQKAPIVMRQLEQLVGKETFRAGLREYLQRFKYSNANWPQLIEILDRKTSENLAAWSQVWVDEPGMPEIRAEIDADNKSIHLLQVDPRGRKRIWSQNLSLRLGMANAQHSISVKLRQAETRIHTDLDLRTIHYLLANGDGQGYGYFRLDEASRQYFLQHVWQNADAVARAVALLSLWEEMLHEKIPPEALLDCFLELLEHESETQLIQWTLDRCVQLFWKFHPEPMWPQIAPRLETSLWQGMSTARATNLKSAYFRAYRNVAITPAGVERLQQLWNRRLEIQGLPLTENDEIALALELAVRNVRGVMDILHEQLARTKNPDRQAELHFILPALSPNEREQDDFFASLQDLKNRRREAWVLRALRYLHHPLRAAGSRKFILPALQMVQEIQRTGDIFFPKRWLDATLGGHNSPEAATIVQEFLDRAVDLPDRLRGKVLQSADLLFRAARIVYRRKV